MAGLRSLQALYKLWTLSITCKLFLWDHIQRCGSARPWILAGSGDLAAWRMMEHQIVNSKQGQSFGMGLFFDIWVANADIRYEQTSRIWLAPCYSYMTNSSRLNSAYPTVFARPKLRSCSQCHSLLTFLIWWHYECGGELEIEVHSCWYFISYMAWIEF